MSTAIKEINARQILDSRGNPTIEVEVKLFSGINGVASVPSGASTGKFEAVELRDNEPNNYDGKSVQKAVYNVNKIIAPILTNKNVTNQNLIDKTLINLDGTENKSNLGANAILGVSMACAKASANSFGQPLFMYLGGISANTLPVPMMNILNGGIHAQNNLEFQEFMIAPIGAKTFSQALQMGTKVFHTLKRNLNKRGLSTGVGDEGGFAPNLKTNSEAIELIIDAIQNSNYTTDEIKICLDVASSEFYNNGKYFVRDYGYSSSEFVEVLEKLVKDYPIISIEDGLSEEDYEGWELLTQTLGNKCQLVGDDLFVTNIKRLKKGVLQSLGNSILIKLNQIGTVSETLNTINYAQNNNYTTIISHRSGETEDTFIADLAVAVNSGLIKTGSLSRSERIAKYNRLLKIEQMLGSNARYLGKNAFNPK
ncbi:MAG: phosphopyruvate hydratase [Candidatus Melainabacteria bacterium]|jgi:phosphopyruvate hydratase|nr:MAG: phosphopyruvate hydratase [Candidatus Melainabacteria bacterium]